MICQAVEFYFHIAGRSALGGTQVKRSGEMFQSHSGTALRRTLLLVVMAPHAHHLHAPHHQQCDCQKGELTTGLTTVAVAKYENARKIQRHSCKENVFALHLSQCYSAFISHAVQALIIKKGHSHAGDGPYALSSTAFTRRATSFQMSL